MLVLENDLTSGQTALPIALIRSSSADFEIILDESYIPPCLGSQKQQHLKAYISEIYGLLMQKSNSLANAVNDPNTGGSVEVMDFMMLQTINRYLAYLHHENEGARQTHPEQLFINLSKLCADLMTFLPSRKVGDIPVYEHNDLTSCFGKLFFNLRKSLSIVLEQRAIRIPLDMRDEATRVAQTPDQSLLDKASFVLAIKADMPNEAYHHLRDDHAEHGIDHQQQQEDHHHEQAARAAIDHPPSNGADRQPPVAHTGPHRRHVMHAGNEDGAAHHPDEGRQPAPDDRNGRPDDGCRPRHRSEVVPPEHVLVGRHIVDAVLHGMRWRLVVRVELEDLLRNEARIDEITGCHEG